MPLKKKAPNDEEMEVSDSGSGNSSDSDNDQEFDEHNEEIQVDFEGRNPIDSDFDGIRQLLKQLFRSSDINLSELANYIIGQNYIGSVVTQCDDDEDEDEDDEMTDSNVVYGITTAINLKKSEVGCISQLRNYVTQKAKEKAPKKVYQQFKSILENPENVVGFLLNERFINIPPLISVPLMESLVKEINRANQKKMPFQFTHYLMLSKFHQMSTKKSKGTTSTVYSNGEEEIFVENANVEFDFSVETAENEPESSDVVPFRKVFIFETAKLPQIIESIKSLIG